MGAGISTKGSSCGLACVAALVGMISASAASAQDAGGGQPPPSIRCDQGSPQIKPLFLAATDSFENNVDCLAWQDFIYLMWPADAAQRGVPDPTRTLGASGPTVWETYRTIDTVFLPGGRDPGPWQQPLTVRQLTMTSKIAPAVLTNIARSAAASRAAFPPAILNAIKQAGGGTLYDLNGQPVYYEVAIDEPEYDYIRKNGLYDSYKQAAFALTNVIALPSGQDGVLQRATGAVEIKAAWKVLSGNDNADRFRTVQAQVGDSKAPVTVGLVGFHMFVLGGVRGSSQGAWATFAQVDNAPLKGGPIKPPYNFFNPNCKEPGKPSPCPVNVKDANPGQVMQITADASQADKLNLYMQFILNQSDPKSPWQYYKLIDVQWPKHPINISKSKPPLSTPLPDGTPNVPLRGKDMLNPVIETFVQLPKAPPGVGCLTCHRYASTSAMGPHLPPRATSYSFIFEHATSLATR